MGILDRLFNTYSKRLFVLSAVMAGFFMTNLMKNYQIGIAIRALGNVNELFSLVDNPVIRTTLVGRLLINYLDNGYGLLRIITDSFGAWRFAGLVLIVMLLVSRLPKKMNCIKVLILIGFTLVCVEYMAVIYIGTSAMTFSNPVVVMEYLHRVGNLFVYFSLTEIVYTLFGVFFIAYKLLSR